MTRPVPNGSHRNPDPHRNQILIGIDDTDNLETRGTGYRARQLIALLEEKGLGTGVGVTRHQLLVDDRVPYTSHNSSACLLLEREKNVDNADIWDVCRKYLLEIAADGSDVGLCITNWKQANEVVEFGLTAKEEVVSQNDALNQANYADIWLAGLTGDYQGIIGALSAVGLHVHGNDGRYIWPREIRDVAGHTVPLCTLLKTRGIDCVTLTDGTEIHERGAQITLGEWPRTVRIDNRAVLLVEKSDAEHHYKVLDKTSIKSIRP